MGGGKLDWELLAEISTISNAITPQNAGFQTSIIRKTQTLLVKNTEAITVGEGKKRKQSSIFYNGNTKPVINELEFVPKELFG